ncbi:MAG TPA: DMT family transporter, partial [Terriglobales bacterium]|nr:DMT family transporter [Terriglobales bacterium]
ASKSAFLTGISVVLVPLFLALFWRRAIGRWSAAGVGFAVMGLYLLTIPQDGGVLNFRSLNPGDLLTLLAAIVFAFHIIYMGHATQAHSWRQIVTIQTGFSACLMIVAVPLGEKIWGVWSGRVIAGILLTGFFSLALAFAIQAWAQQFTPATHTALIFSLEPVFASITSLIFLGERLGGRAVLGGALILAGVLISEEKGTQESLAVAPDHAAVPHGATEAAVAAHKAQER